MVIYLPSWPSLAPPWLLLGPPPSWSLPGPPWSLSGPLPPWSSLALPYGISLESGWQIFAICVIIVSLVIFPSITCLSKGQLPDVTPTEWRIFESNSNKVHVVRNDAGNHATH
ncbi:uncharacterized protein BJ212DRAFT_1295961 [Suillus subaureus]|uniref:Uncharacterized protein n=1 Tax=Suillus subaureus TaxID=48587 RepID=A0A9P7EME9_9AGAM|nr:uncharacterized protein BJ212DRAFT_1295961 [Suillus subaureus]KAG1824915.1 hypothetical protein BJ212DRAFT_1295961 [Suillus subaureus]